MSASELNLRRRIV